MRRVLVAIIATCLACPPLTAQGQTPIAPGTRVRIKTFAAPDEWLIGTLSRSDSTSIHVGGSLVARSSIRAVEVSQGAKSQAGKGAGRGALGGLAIGAIAGMARGEVYDDPVTPPVMAIAGGVVGALVGGLIGAASSAESWQRADRNGLSVALMPISGGGTGLRLAMQF